MDAIVLHKEHELFPVHAIDIAIYLQKIHPMVVIGIMRYSSQGKASYIFKCGLVLTEYLALSFHKGWQLFQLGHTQGCPRYKRVLDLHLVG